MQLHLKTSTAAPIPAPVAAQLRFAHQRCMFGFCKDIIAYSGHVEIGGAHLVGSTLTWFVDAAGTDLTYRHDLSISLDANLAAIDRIIGDEFAKTCAGRG